MKKNLLSIILGALFCTQSYAAMPHHLDFETIVHDANNSVLVTKPAGVRISILRGSAKGDIVYEETHTITTNETGVAAIKIGTGRIAQGFFPNINWALGPYFIKTEIDPTGGSAYSIAGTSELISVTHVLHESGNASNKTSAGQGINAGGTISIATANGFSGSVADNGATAVITLNPLVSPALGGIPTAPTAPAGTNTMQLANTAFVTTAVSSRAPLASPTFTGTPRAPAPAATSNSTQLATTAFVVSKTGAKADINNPTFTGLLTAPLANINGGTINSTTVGATSPASGAFTNLSASGITTLSNATPSTSTGTGALVVSGGLGVGGTVTAGGFVGPISATSFNGIVQIANGGTGSSTSTDALANLGAAPLASPNFTGSVTIPAGTINAGSIGATTPGTGAFTSLTASGITTIANTTPSTGPGTGALVVNGGLGVAGTINAGAFSGPINANNVTGVLGTANGGTGVSSAAQNLVFAAPISGSGAPSFRALVAADLPAMPPVSAGWGLTGNAGMVDGVNFIGTTDDVPFTIRVGNVQAGRIEKLIGSPTGGDAGNTFFGYLAGKANTGARNVAMGYESLSFNNSGVNNIAIGSSALRYNTTGGGNIAVGNSAMWNNFTGMLNTSIGLSAMFMVTSGNENVAVGANSSGNLGASSFNVAAGVSTLSASRIGSGNTAIGYQAISNLDNSAFNTALGYQAFTNAPPGTTNSTAVGNGAQVTASNMIRLGNTAVTIIQGNAAYTQSSDQRLKEDIQPLAEGTNFIMKLRPVSYRMKNPADNRRNWGLIAQDIEALLGTDNAMLTVSGDTDRTLGLRYTDFIAPLIKAVQEQEEVIKSLEGKNSQLQAQMNTLQAQVANLHKLISEKGKSKH
ncbi:MAG: hypothetical protein RL748_2105 [Pseudomonadota bacterium]|jgi:hypothetical protein